MFGFSKGKILYRKERYSNVEEIFVQQERRKNKTSYHCKKAMIIGEIRKIHQQCGENFVAHLENDMKTANIQHFQDVSIAYERKRYNCSSEQKVFKYGKRS